MTSSIDQALKDASFKAKYLIYEWVAETETQDRTIEPGLLMNMFLNTTASIYMAHRVSEGQQKLNATLQRLVEVLDAPREHVSGELPDDPKIAGAVSGSGGRDKGSDDPSSDPGVPENKPSEG